MTKISWSTAAARVALIGAASASAPFDLGSSSTPSSEPVNVVSSATRTPESTLRSRPATPTTSTSTTSTTTTSTSTTTTTIAPVVTITTAPSRPAPRATVPAPRPVVSAPTPVPVVEEPASTAGSCDPNYSGACVPADVRDVDCAGGRGNGPEYVVGPARVVGVDHYGLDGDGDGVGCK